MQPTESSGDHEVVKAVLSALCAGLLLALTAGACGGDSDDTAGLELPAGHGAVVVIDEWAQTLDKGDVEGAAEFFALPSIVQNGTPLLTLRTRADAVEFNRSLPCGAKLVDAEPRGRFIAVTFRLSERPGPGICGTGVGATARTAFLIRDGKIVQWRRLPDTGQTGPTGQPT
jgi:hypothetical protein